MPVGAGLAYSASRCAPIVPVEWAMHSPERDTFPAGQPEKQFPAQSDGAGLMFTFEDARAVARPSAAGAELAPVPAVIVPSPKVRNDIDTIVETHGLSGPAQEKLIRIVTGAVPGNRDRPLFGLVRSIEAEIAAKGGGALTLFDLLAQASGSGREPKLSRLSLALLDFLATMDEYRHFDAIAGAVAALATGHGDAGRSTAVRVLASCLHRYRVDHLPFENRRQAFSTIRFYFDTARPGSGLPVDADAIAFWSEVASPNGWTTYVATLAVLADFVAAANMRAASAESSLEAMTEKGFDASTDLFTGVEDEEPDLLEAAKALDTAELKIFKGPEIEELRKLASALPAVQRWRRSGLAALCFGPVQNVLVQIKRQGISSNRLAGIAACDNVRDYVGELEILADIEQTCRDIAELYRNLVRGDNRMASPLSMTEVETSKRIARIMRRQSFAEREPAALRRGIAEILPALAIVATRLDRVLRQLRAWPAPARNAAFDEDRQRFAETFARLYCATGS